MTYYVTQYNVVGHGGDIGFRSVEGPTTHFLTQSAWVWSIRLVRDISEGLSQTWIGMCVRIVTRPRCLSLSISLKTILTKTMEVQILLSDHSLIIVWRKKLAKTRKGLLFPFSFTSVFVGAREPYDIGTYFPVDRSLGYQKKIQFLLCENSSRPYSNLIFSKFYATIYSILNHTLDTSGHGTEQCFLWIPGINAQQANVKDKKIRSRSPFVESLRSRTLIQL